MTDPDTMVPPADTWEGILAALRRRYPGQKDSVLFCIYKLQHNPELTLRDFRAEAELHGIPMAGRSLYSAKVLLGIVRPDPSSSSSSPSSASSENGPGDDDTPAPTPRTRRSASAPAAEEGASIESKVVAAVRQIQQAAGAESDQLRAAIRQAIAILQRALGS